MSMKPKASQVLYEIGAMILVLTLAAGIGFVAGQETCRRDCHVAQQ